MGQLKLTIELRKPSFAQGKTVRKSIGNKLWDKVREAIFKENLYTCSICGMNDLSLEAHEVWDYDVKNAVIVLKNIQCLCYLCHDTKHQRNSLLRTKKEDRKKKALILKEHFKKVNDCNDEVYQKHYREGLLKIRAIHPQLTKENDYRLEPENEEELNHKKWAFSVYESIPFYDEVIQRLDKKGLLWKKQH